MAKPIDQIEFNELVPTLKALAKAGGTTEHFDWIRGRSNAAKLVRFMDEQIGTGKKPVTQEKESGLVHGLFTSTAKQIERVREWNRELGWGIPDEAFAEAEKSVPAWPEERLVAVVLVPYIADKVNKDETVTTGLERTFHELWMRAKAEQDASWRWDGYDKAGPDRLRLLKGIEHVPGLRWEVIDLGCNRNKKPMDVRSVESSPHAGILAAAALHPEWVKSMDGDKVPYVFAPGYEVNVPDGSAWRHVPLVDFGRDARKLRLSYGWGDYPLSLWAVPSFLRE